MRAGPDGFIYLLTDDRRTEYTGPGNRPGKASIGFGGTAEDVHTLIADLNQAIRSAAPAHAQRYRPDLELALAALQRARGRILAATPSGATSPPG